MSEMTKDTWTLGGHEFTSRFILGSGKYSLELIDAAVKEAKAEIVTMALRRANEGGVANILDYIPKNVTLLPNTSGARNAEEAVRIARLSQTFGAGISYEENRVFAQFAKAAMNKTDIVLHTAGKSVGNYCYTRDAVMGILLLLVKGNDGEAYTVAHPEAHITIGDMAKMVAEKLANNEIKVVFDIPKAP